MFKNPTPLHVTDVHINDSVYYLEPWANQIVKAAVQSIRIENGNWIAVCQSLEMPGKRDIPLECVFHSLNNIRLAIRENEAAISAEYDSQLNTPEDMVRFAWKYPITMCKEYTDLLARKAFSRAAMRIMGIDLDRESDERI